MQPRSSSPTASAGRRSALLLLLAAAAAVGSAPASGQSDAGMALKRAAPGAGAPTAGPSCPAAVQPSPANAADRDHARDLAGRAQQSAILGDYDSARDLFASASQLDPTNAGLAYDLARAEEQAKNPHGAIAAYCRYLSLAPQAPEAADARDRLASLAADEGPAIPAAATDAFQDGVTRFDRRDYAGAAAQFARAASLAPTWPEPHYDLAMVSLAQDHEEEAARHFENYLRLRPEAEDRDLVVARIDALRQSSLSPSGALVRGLVFPGYGQLYTRRPLLGLAVAGGVAGSLWFGLESSKGVVTRHARDPFGNPYSYTQREVTRPHLAGGVAAAVGLAVVAALEAYHTAGHQRAAASPQRTAAALVAPSATGLMLGVSLALPGR